MARKLRIFIQGLPYYIEQRGNNNGNCFFDDCSYEFYLNKLKSLLLIHSVDLHAYSLLKNQVQLLVTPQKKNGIPALMKTLGSNYVQYINKINCRSGSLWEGRYRSVLVQPSDFILEYQKRIELTPVRYGIVKRPGEYKWSSYCTNAFGGNTGYITSHQKYLDLGDKIGDRSLVYRKFLEDKVRPDVYCVVKTKAINSMLGV